MRVLAALVAGVLLCSGIAGAHEPSTASNERAAAGASAEYIDQRLEELRRITAQLEAQQAGLRKDIASAEPRREALESQLAELADLFEKAQTRLDVADARLADVQAQLDATTAELERKERALQSTIGKLEARAVTVYKHGPASLFELVLGAESFGELLRRFAFALRLAHADNHRVELIKRQKAAILTSWELIDDLREKRAREAARVRAERNRAAGVRSVVDAQHSVVAGELRAQYAQLGSIEQQKQRYIAETQQLEAESAAIAAFLGGKTDSAPTVSPKGMSWPVRGPVTSGYGWRTHPIFGTRRFHTGIDIGAASGTPIGAAASGAVVFAGAKTGYGNTVIVYHGGGISTLYGHMSSIGAGNGAQVTRGQSIGRVGCTGYCTGPHLHFEVRVNGNHVDPMGWLP